MLSVENTSFTEQGRTHDILGAGMGHKQYIQKKNSSNFDIYEMEKQIF